MDRPVFKIGDYVYTPKGTSHVGGDGYVIHDWPKDVIWQIKNIYDVGANMSEDQKQDALLYVYGDYDVILEIAFGCVLQNRTGAAFEDLELVPPLVILARAAKAEPSFGDLINRFIPEGP